MRFFKTKPPLYTFHFTTSPIQERLMKAPSFIRNSLIMAKIHIIIGLRITEKFLILIQVLLKNFQKTTSPYIGLIVKKTCRFDYFGYAVNLEFKFELNWSESRIHGNSIKSA